jgi:hypothetical protein
LGKQGRDISKEHNKLKPKGPQRETKRQGRARNEGGGFYGVEKSAKNRGYGN